MPAEKHQVSSPAIAPVDPGKLVSLSERRRLQEIFDRCVRIASQPDYDCARLEPLLRECVYRDLGNDIYVEAYLQNLGEICRRRPERGLSAWARRRLRAARRREDWTGLLGKALTAAARRPHAAEPLQMLGLAAWHWKWEESALRFLGEAARRAPQSPEIQYDWAEVLLHSGRFEAAAEVWQKLGDPGKAELVAWLSPPELPPELMRDLRRLRAADQSVAEISASGLAMVADLIDGEYFSQAAELAQWLLTVTPGDASVYESLERVRIAQARAQLGQAERLENGGWVDARLVQRFADNVNRVELEVYTRRHQAQPTAPVPAFELGLRLKAAGNYDEAIEPLEIGLADAKLGPRAALELGECAQYLRRFDEAAQWYRQSLELSEGDDEVRRQAIYRLAVLELAEGRVAKAEQLFRRIPENYRQTAHHLDKIEQIRHKGEFSDDK